MRQFHHGSAGSSGSGSGNKSIQIVSYCYDTSDTLWKCVEKPISKVPKIIIFIYFDGYRSYISDPRIRKRWVCDGDRWRLGRTAGDTKASWTAAPEEGYERLRGSTVFFTYLRISRISQNGSIQHHVTNVG